MASLSKVSYEENSQKWFTVLEAALPLCSFPKATQVGSLVGKHNRELNFCLLAPQPNSLNYPANMIYCIFNDIQFRNHHELGAQSGSQHNFERGQIKAYFYANC